MENIFYVYLHRRKTDNKVFYVGKGKNNRANSKHSRSKWWNSTVEKHGLIVEIVFENLSEDESLQCEKDTILEFKYFGHPLVNMTQGGDGVSGYRHTEEHKRKISTIGKGRKCSADHCLAISKARAGKVGLKSTNADRNIYKFLHASSGKEFLGTRSELCEAFKVPIQSLRSLFGSKPHAKTCHGWRLQKENNDTNPEEKTEEH